jgi:hypothetical protein
MLPIKTRSVFKSRWMALLWAGGIVWSATEFAGSQPHHSADANAQGNGDAAADSTDSADVQAAVNALDGIK